MNEFQHTQFIFIVFRSFSRERIRFRPHNEEETRVPTVNDLVSTVFQERALQFRPTQTFTNDFGLECRSFINRDPFIIGRKPRLALLVSEKEEMAVSHLYSK